MLLVNIGVFVFVTILLNYVESGSRIPWHLRNENGTETCLSLKKEHTHLYYQRPKVSPTINIELTEPSPVEPDPIPKRFPVAHNDTRFNFVASIIHVKEPIDWKKNIDCELNGSKRGKFTTKKAAGFTTAFFVSENLLVTAAHAFDESTWNLPFYLVYNTNDWYKTLSGNHELNPDHTKRHKSPHAGEPRVLYVEPNQRTLLIGFEDSKRIGPWPKDFSDFLYTEHGNLDIAMIELKKDISKIPLSVQDPVPLPVSDEKQEDNWPKVNHHTRFIIPGWGAKHYEHGGTNSTNENIDICKMLEIPVLRNIEHTDDGKKWVADWEKQIEANGEGIFRGVYITDYHFAKLGEQPGGNNVCQYGDSGAPVLCHRDESTSVVDNPSKDLFVCGLFLNGHGGDRDEDVLDPSSFGVAINFRNEFVKKRLQDMLASLHEYRHTIDLDKRLVH